MSDTSQRATGILLSWRLELAIVALIAAGLFLPSVAGEFVYDDHWTIVHNPFLRDAANLPQLFDGRAVRAGVPDAWRPLAVATHMLDLQLFGDRPAGHHLQNLLWHVGVVLLVGLLALRLSASPRLATTAALLFAAHPIHVEPVSAINYREDLLATFFCLAALSLLLAEGRAGRSLRRASAAAALLLLGLLSKGTAAVAPVLLVLARRAQGASLRAALRASAPLWAALAVFVAFRLISAGSLDPYPAAGVSPATADDGALLRAGSSLVAFAATVSRLLVPVGLSPEYPPPSTGPVAIVASLAALGVLLLFAWRQCGSAAARTTRPASVEPRVLAGVGIAFLLVAWLPTAGVLALPNYQADRYAYLPSVGLCLALAPLLWEPRGRPWRLIALVFLLVSHGVVTVLQQRSWHNDLALWSRAVTRAPASARAWSGLARALRRDGRVVAARRAGERAVALSPASPEAHLALANVLAQGRRYAAAEPHYARAAAGAVRHPSYVYASWGWAAFRAGDAERAAGLLRRATSLRPRFAGSWLNLARVEVARGRCAAAKRAVAEASRLDPPGAQRHLVVLRRCAKKTPRSRPPEK